MNASEILSLFNFTIQFNANKYLHLYNKEKSEIKFVEDSE